jgi:hypothetical protein
MYIGFVLLPCPCDVEDILDNISPSKVRLSLVKPDRESFPSCLLEPFKIDVRCLNARELTPGWFHCEAQNMNQEVDPFCKTPVSYVDEAA